MTTIDIQIDELFATQADAALIEQAVLAALAGETLTEPVEVSVLVTSDEALRALNTVYRGVDAPTDVLSFGGDDEAPAEPGVPAFVRPPGAARYLGDIAISYERVLAQAAEYGHSTARELAFLTVHGTLHLLGYDHERGPEDEALMQAREAAAMERLGLPRG